MVAKTHDRAALVAAFPAESIHFRVGGNAGGGRKYALAYVDARMVAERLDHVVPGWSFHLDRCTQSEALPRPRKDREGAWHPTPQIRLAATGRLTISGVERMDVGEAVGFADDDKLVKTAASDALKRCAVLFGVGAYLYSLPQFVVDDSDISYGQISAAATTRLRGEYQAAITGQAAPAPVAPAAPLPAPPAPVEATPVPVEASSNADDDRAALEAAARDLFPRGWPFGDEKGKDILNVKYDTLEWYVERSKPGDPKYAEKTQRQKEFCKRVMQWQQAGADALSDALQPVLAGGSYEDDDIPF